MIMAKLVEVIDNLKFDTMTPIYTNGTHTLYIFRPSKLSKRFETYNVNNNFQIFLQIGDSKPFRPNHLRLLIDLKLRSREIPDSKTTLLEVFDSIFYGEDPNVALSRLDIYSFTSAINPLDITANLAQLFIAEQNIGFGGKSKYNPPSLYIHGCISDL